MNSILEFIDGILCRLFDKSPITFILCLVGLIALASYGIMIGWCWSVILINEFIKGI
jgi:hypothetical protein